MYSNWNLFFPENIRVIGIELAGRGKRINESNYSDFDALIEDMLSKIRIDLLNKKYYLFGHSLGGKIVYELSKKIATLGLRMPEQLFIAGRGAPNIPDIKSFDFEHLSHDEFIDELKNIGGTPIEFFDHPELLELYLPVLRNDFKMGRRDASLSEIKPLDCDISIFVGKEDELSYEQIGNWNKHTNGICSIYYLNGGHFFMPNNLKFILQKIKTSINK